MAELLEVPVQGEDVLLVEVDREQLPAGDGLVLASNAEGVVGRAAVTLEEAFDHLTPALTVVAERLRTVTPHAMTVEFGIKLGGETGIILAKGTAEVNFKVSLAWASKE